MEAVVVALETIFSWPTLAFVLIGTLLGVVFGALPGLGGSIALALLIPVTFGMDPTNAMVLFGSTLGGVAFGGSVSAILINTPGTAPNAATCFDGYPMAKQGRASEALGAAATASALGAVFGLAILMLLLPVARELILAFTPPEFFLLALLGLSVIAVTAQGHLLKGLIAGGVGLMFAFIGFSGVTSEYRYGFGTMYLWDGIQLVPAIIGLFAIAEVLNLVAKGGTIADTEDGNLESDQSTVWQGVRGVLARPVLFLKSATIGVLIGIVPGVGGTVANFISYMQAVQSSKTPEIFGNGAIEGVIASEAANDSKDGGTLLPTVVFGIPGGAPTAVLLGGFLLHGLTPGREMLSTDLPILMVLVISLLMANLLTSSIGLVFANQLSRLTLVPVDLIAPAILVISVVGSFAMRNNLADVGITLVFGLVGYGMIALDYSRVAIVIALILGSLAERSFHQSLMISDSGYLIFVSRPLSLLLLVAIVASITLPFVRQRFGLGREPEVMK